MFCKLRDLPLLTVGGLGLMLVVVATRMLVGDWAALVVDPRAATNLR